MTDVNIAVRARLKDFVENALDPQAAAAACLAALDLHQPFTKAGMTLCRECSPSRDGHGDHDGRHYVLMPWPCFTWKAVARVLVGDVVDQQENDDD